MNKEVYGEPGVPPEFRKYLLKKTVDASTIAVGASKLEASIADFFFKDTVITLNVGKKQGVFVGMEFQLLEPDEFESATVMKIFPDRCEAMVRQIDQESNPPQVDWRWSTARRNLKVENE